MALPSTRALENLVLYYVNSKRLRPTGYIHEFSREGTAFPYRPSIVLRLVYMMMLSANSDYR